MPRRVRRPPRDYLSSRIHLGMKFGLETMRALVEELGHPERAFPTLLVAGTNGKGSVVAYADSVLRASGLVVGRYTSPHLVRVNERIVISGRPISDRALGRAVGRVRDAAEALARSRRLPSEPTFFEVVTAAAFAHFASAGVEVAVLEVGMGGRLDATNVADPLSSAIVTIDHDHEAYLGTTLAAIAREKAGVLRRGRVTVLGPMADEARRAIQTRARGRGARVADSARDTTIVVGGRGRLVVATPQAVYRGLVALPGVHQHANAAVAIRLLEEARAAGLAVDLAKVPAGLAHTRWPGRLQRIPGRPPLIVDGAHNPAAARALAEELRHQPPFILVFAAMADKDIAAMGRILLPLARDVVLTRVPGDRAAPPLEIARRVEPLAAKAHVAETVPAALARARRLAGPQGLVVAAGSLYLAGEVLRSVAAGRRGSRPRK